MVLLLSAARESDQHGKLAPQPRLGLSTGQAAGWRNDKHKWIKLARLCMCITRVTVFAGALPCTLASQFCFS